MAKKSAKQFIDGCRKVAALESVGPKATARLELAARMAEKDGAVSSRALNTAYSAAHTPDIGEATAAALLETVLSFFEAKLAAFLKNLLGIGGKKDKKEKTADDQEGDDQEGAGAPAD